MCRETRFDPKLHPVTAFHILIPTFGSDGHIITGFLGSIDPKSTMPAAWTRETHNYQVFDQQRLEYA